MANVGRMAGQNFSQNKTSRAAKIAVRPGMRFRFAESCANTVVILLALYRGKGLASTPLRLTLASLWRIAGGNGLTNRRTPLVFVLASSKRRQKMTEEAKESRASALHWNLAWLFVIIYNLVGIADICSTVFALRIGAGEEANPIVLGMMNHAGDGWIIAKLFLQGVISFMVVWFPHWIVLTFFAVATAGNALVVANNLAIAGVL